MIPSEQTAFLNYREEAVRLLQLNFPTLTHDEIAEAVDWSVNKRFQNADCTITNSYKNKVYQQTLLDLTNYILDKKPITTPSGVMFMQHGAVPNPLVRMVEQFLSQRKVYKKQMFKYPKGSREFEKYNLYQLLEKLSANAIYGSIGQSSCIYYNLYVANSVTFQGMSAISTAALLFEGFLGDNNPFSSLNELVTFIDNVLTDERKYDDCMVLNENITIEECFMRLITNTGFGFVPDEEDMQIIWDMLQNLGYEDINRLFYKNNLYHFMDNKFVMDKVKVMLVKLQTPYMDPNTCPDEIKDDIHEFWNLLKEYVYYPHQIQDRLGKMVTTIRNIAIIMDTDSSIISFDAWYRYVLERVYNIDMHIMHDAFDPLQFYKKDEFGDLEKPIEPLTFYEPNYDFDFYSDERIEIERSIDPIMMCPQEGLRYSIINIMAYCITQMINDYMSDYARNSNATHPEHGCLLIMKNEFLFKRALITDGKKNYATIQELQEGNKIPKNKQLDIKGLPIDKVGIQPATKKKLHKILYEDILNAKDVDQVKILKHLAIVERSIFNEMQSGSKKYFKPVSIKSMAAYDNPMRIQGIKASMAYNALKNPDSEAIDLSKRNSIDIIKCTLNKKNVSELMADYPDVYERALKLLETAEFKDGITAVSLPLNEEVPKWLYKFLEYKETLSDNIKNFPLESIGLSQTSNSHVAYSNILKI